MAKQNINVGTAANDKKGDSLRAAFQKVNANFTELYVALGLDSGGLNLGAFEFTGSTLSTTDSSSIIIDQATTVTSNLSVGGDIVPQTANGGDLGSIALPWRSLYVSNSTVYLGGVPLSLEVGTNELKINNVPISQNITYTDIPNAPTDLADLTDTSGLLEMSTLVNGAYTVSLGSDGLLNAAGPVTLPNYGEFRPSSAAYDAALAGWESFRSQEAESAALLGYTEANRPFIEWRVNGGNVAAYLAELDRVWAIQNTIGATLVWTPAISSALRAQMRVAMQIVQSAYASVGSDVSIASGQGKYWNFGGDGSLTIPGDIKSNGNINIEINLTDSTLRRWQFGEDGHLTLPTGGDIKDSTGTSVLGGGSVSSLVNGANTVSLGATGTLTVPANGIITAPIAQEFQLQAKDEDSVLRNEINLDPNNGTYMSVWGGDDNEFFDTGDWDTASWVDEEGDGYANITNAVSLYSFWTTGVGSVAVEIEVSINGGARIPVTFDSGDAELGNVDLFFLGAVPDPDPTTITSLNFFYRIQSRIAIDYDNGEILLDGQAMGIQLRTTETIDLRSAQNLNLRSVGSAPVRIYTEDDDHMWEFDSTGSLTLPREGKIYGIGAPNDRAGYISWDGNSSGDGLGWNTMRLVPDLQGLEDVDTYIILDPAYVDGETGSIHIRAGGTQDNSLAHLYLGGENSHVRIDAGLNPPVTVMANNRSWTFGTDGAITTTDVFTLNVPGSTTTVTGLANWVGNNLGGWDLPSYINLATTGGSGTGLTVDVVGYPGGGYINISDITINTPGSGYTNGDVITINNQENYPGTFTVSVTATANTWQLGDGLRFPDNTVQTTAAESFSFSVAADDSTQRAISNNELIKFIGAGGVTTASDAEGNITITGNTGAITAETFNTDQITIVGNRISTTVTNANLELDGNGVGRVVINAIAEATTASTTRAVGYLGLPQAGSSVTQTLTIAESGKHIYITAASQIITIPAASSVAYPIGTTLTFIAGPSATTVTIAINTDTLRLAGGTSTGSRTLAANGMATAVKVSGTSSAGEWYINGIGLT